MDKHIVVYNGILLSHDKDQRTNVCYDEINLEIYQIQKVTYCMISFMQNMQNWDI